MSFYKAFFPIVLATLIALIAIIFSLGLTGRIIDKSRLDLSLQSVKNYTKMIHRIQETLILDYSEWDQSFTQLTIKGDMEWFLQSIGEAELLNTTIHGMAFLKNDGRLIKQFTRNDNDDFIIPEQNFRRDLLTIKQNLFTEIPNSYEVFSSFQIANGTVALVSYSPITHTNPEKYPEILSNQRDFLVFWTFYTPNLLSEMSEELDLENLTLTEKEDVTGFPLKDNKGQIISQFNWTPNAEGINSIRFARYTSISMFLLLLLGGYISYHRVKGLIKELEISRKKEEKGHKIKSEFLATMSHELRTPLNSIIGFSDILKSGAIDHLNEQQEEYIGHIQDSGKHLLNIINEILDMSKIESGKYELYEVEINLRQTLNQSIVFLEKEAQDKNITLIKEIPKPLNEFMGDEKVIRQLMLNLLSNSIKFTPAGGQVTLGCSVTESQEMEIYVEDNGIGISPEKLDIITEPYMQDQDHKTRSHQGTGLGLAISKAFVEMHQGTMTIQSKLGEGTRISLLFPASRVLDEML